jgi:hypothetical protein
MASHLFFLSPVDLNFATHPARSTFLSRPMIEKLRFLPAEIPALSPPS